MNIFNKQTTFPLVTRRTKLLLGSFAVGAGVVLTARAVKRWRAGRGSSGLRSVARFGVRAMAHRQDAVWEGLAGRSLFKQLCAQLASAGYPPSDIGDIEAAHQCVVHVGKSSLYLTMQPTDHYEWDIILSRSLGSAHSPGPAPKNRAPVRRFLSVLDQALNALDETEEVRWLRRQDCR